MKKNYLLGYSLVALFLLFTSCSQNEEDELIPESTKVTIEPDFFEADGSVDPTVLEEEAPIDENQDFNKKTYRHHNYKLLKPSNNQDKIDAVCGETKTMSLLVGARKKKVGEVEVSNDDENLYLSFTADEHKYMKKVYLYIGEKGNMPKYSNGYPNLRKFNFKAFPYYYGGTKKAIYTIPLSSIDADSFEIVAYSKVYDNSSRCFYSSFAYDKNLTQTYSYSYYSRCYYYYNEWVRSFNYEKQDCEEEECMDVYGRKLKDYSAICLNTSPGPGWSTSFWLSYIHNKTIGWEGYAEMLLFANVPDDCDLTNTVQVGRVEVTTVDNGLNFKYVLNQGYSYDEINLYVGDHIFDENNDSFYSTTSENSIFIPWTGDLFLQTSQVFVTTNLKVCQDGD